LLKQGVEGWNAWRKTNPVKSDLSGALLTREDLIPADLAPAQRLP
jgi:hypothetical protein